jgi:HlyD family secretion protein
VVLVIAGVAAFFVFRSQGGGPQVDTATVEQQDLSVKVQASGKVQAGMKADLFPPTVGTLDEVFVEDGQKVTAGQQIAVMDKGPLELQVAQAETGVDQARAQLSAAEQQAPSSQDVNAAKANVNAAKSALNAAKVSLDSAEYAYSAAQKTTNQLEKAVETSPALLPDLEKARLAESQARAGVAQANAGVSQADAAYKGAQAQLAKVQGSSTADAETAARAGLAQAQDALTLAKANLDAATFVAPFDGVVFFNPTGTPGADGQIPKASAGSAVAPQSAPFSVVDLTGVTFTAEVDEADIDRLKAGMTGEVRLDAFPGDAFSSRVIEVRSAAQQTATGGTVFPVDMSIDNKDKNLLIGMKGDADISVSSIGSALIIPVEALFDQNGKSYVYVVEGGRLAKTDITTGAITDTTVQILSGLEAGQVVALSGSVEYTDGMAVRTK